MTHQPFDDPPRLAADLEDDQAKMQNYRRVRDEFRQYVEMLPDSLQNA